MRFLLIATLAIALLTGCTTGGERTLPSPIAGSPVPEGMARISVTRANGFMGSALGAAIAINEQSAGSIFREQSTSADVLAGVTTVAVSAFGSPGRFVLRLPTVSGGHYDLVVAPRG